MIELIEMNITPYKYCIIGVSPVGFVAALEPVNNDVTNNIITEDNQKVKQISYFVL